MSDLLSRANGAFLGLAAGDASGLPSRYHQMTRASFRRSLMWMQSAEMDDQHINKLPLPNTHSAPLAEQTFSATDDAEQAALGSAILLRAHQNRAVASDDAPEVWELFAAWQQIVLPQADEYWGSVADRSAILNSEEGLVPPATGTDNPHFFDDSAVARCLPVGVAYAGQPAEAARVARRLASITNAGVGIDAAAAFASVIASTVGGSTVRDAIVGAEAEIDADSWLGRKYKLAEAIFEEAGSLVAAVPAWNDDVANLEYNFGNMAAETLPLALIIARESTSFVEAIGVANLIPKQADTMPAMVGAITGAAHGLSVIPATWRDRVSTLRGYCVPSTAGQQLQEIVDDLVKMARVAS
ncbi:ADP-ribosylglycohydrolase family protein [Leifsonia poae]|uniref:ADP-ribosylglycohydrolase family protein n=1 Tax=Leifsonia poae TaxID=110933 RepID=UPI001CBA9368|nr:ADP-ribosylglycohydrolase family protein [Leifsonia poae]